MTTEYASEGVCLHSARHSDPLAQRTGAEHEKGHAEERCRHKTTRRGPQPSMIAHEEGPELWAPKRAGNGAQTNPGPEGILAKGRRPASTPPGG
jgi:hypothetical protein